MAEPLATVAQTPDGLQLEPDPQTDRPDTACQPPQSCVGASEGHTGQSASSDSNSPSEVLSTQAAVLDSGDANGYASGQAPSDTPPIVKQGNPDSQVQDGSSDSQVTESIVLEHSSNDNSGATDSQPPSKGSCCVENVPQAIGNDVDVSLSADADPQHDLASLQLAGIPASESSPKDGFQHTHARSLSEGSSGSDNEHRVGVLGGGDRDMQLDSDTGSSSISPRDQASSEVSSEDALADLEALRQSSGSVLSDVSSYSWVREGTMGSMVSVDPDSALGRIRADMAAVVSGDGAGDSSSAHPSAAPTSEAYELGNVARSAELTYAPVITLPPYESSPPSSKPCKTEPLTNQLDTSMSAPSTDMIMDTSTTPNQNAPVSVAQVDTNSSSSNQKQPGVSSDSSIDNSITQISSGSETLPVASPQERTETSAPAPSPQPVAAVEETKPSTSVATTKPESSVVKPRVKKTPNDFIFGKVIGEGSYSTVYLAKEVSTQKEFAVKICEKKHLIRERKTHFVMREKEVFMKLDHPFFVKLAYTFQDSERLYYVLTYARNGELLGYLHKLSVFDVPCTRFYTAEIILAVEYLHNLGIIHRDLKPENVLLSEDMHIKITDFGTSKVLQLDENGKPITTGEVKRKNSFVGTAEYVSPEVLNNQPANFGSDLWALGCIIYQCLSGSMPFRSGNEYQTFQKIVKTDFSFPEGFNEDAKDLVSKLLVIEPDQRLGMPGTGGMAALKAHKFYTGVDWDALPQTTPPKLMPYLPATSHNPEFWGQEHRVGFDDQRLAEIITGQSTDRSLSPEPEEVPIRGASPIDGADSVLSEEAASREERLEKQRRENQFHQYVQGNLILKQGFVDKRKGLFARKRMLLLTEGPHLYYVDAHHKVLKGEIPWTKYLRPEAKNFKIFFVHTPNRTYYLESRMPDAQMWVKKIKEVWKRYYDTSQEDNP